jgi:predicted ATPase
MEKYGEKTKKDTGLDFKMRIGLNSGHVVVGSIGDDLRMDYTAVGDTTNLASRMESVARPGTILVTRNTHRIAGDYFHFETLEKIELKGKEEPQEAYELISMSDIDTRFRASVAKGLTPFVGRGNSLPALLEAFDKAKSGSGQVVGIVGEAGVGKSRLLLEMRNRIQQDNITYLEGRCIHFGGSMAYLPLLDILRSYYKIEEGDRANIVKTKIKDKSLNLDEKLNNVLPPFQELLSLKVDDEDFKKLEPQKKREKTFEAIRDLLIRMSQDRPLVIAIEDLHWIDNTTEEFIDYFIGWLPGTPILLIVLYRPEYTHQWGSKSYYNRIGLDQLTTRSSAELVQAILEEGEVAQELKDLILNRAAGNPLFMEEMTYTLLENGSIEKKDHQYVLSGKTSDIQIPDTVQGIIAARMDRLEDNLKRTMQVASVIGRDFAFRILQTITGMREELKSYLLNLQGLEFIYEKSLFPELEYIFKHALTQEVAYDSLLLKRRKEIHESIGNAIEEIYGERLEEFLEMLAYHFNQGEVWDKAVIYLHQSGKRAIEKSAYVEAIVYFRKGLEVLQKLPETSERDELELALQYDLAESLIVSKGYIAPEVEQAFTQAYELCRQVGETPKLIPVLQGLRRLYALRGDRGDAQRARELGEQLLTQAHRQHETALLQEAHWAHGQTLSFLGELSFARTHLEQSNSFYKPQSLSSEASRDAAGTQIACLFFTGWVLWALGYSDQALETSNKALSLAHELSHPFTLAFALWAKAQFNQFRREVQATLERVEATISLSREQGFPVWVEYGTPLRAWSLAMQGNPEDGIAQMRDFMTNKPTLITNANWPIYHAVLVETYGSGEQVEEGLRIVAEALVFVEKTGFRFYESELYRLQGELLLRQAASEGNQAETCFHHALGVARRQKAKSLELRAAMSLSRLWQRQSRREEARKLLVEIYGWFTEGFDTADLKEAKVLLEELA